MNLKNCVLGMEFGTTRIKAVILDEDRKAVAVGSHTWENKFENGVFTYELEAIHDGMRICFSALKADFENKFKIKLTTVGAIALSGMMHGYMAFDKDMNLLAPFRTWRNTFTQKEADILSEGFGFAMPQRWSACHLFKDVLDGQPYVKDIAHIFTLSSYVHYLITSSKTIGICEASGMIPVDKETNAYNLHMVSKFEELCLANGAKINVSCIFPKPVPTGEVAGYLTEYGASMLDESGQLQPGIPFAPPEGDGGTSVIATNSADIGCCSISAGTSVFANTVMDQRPTPIKGVDVLTSPAGNYLAMVQGNTCTADLNRWVKMYLEFGRAVDPSLTEDKVFSLLLNSALNGDKACEGMVYYNYVAGDTMFDLSEGRPMFIRSADASVDLGSFIRAQLYSAFTPVRAGLDLLRENGELVLNKVIAHGGIFKTPVVAQTILSAVVKTPVSLLSTAGEGGCYGVALLAAYMLDKKDEDLCTYLSTKIFTDLSLDTITADKEDMEGYDRYLNRLKSCLPAEREAIKNLK